MKLWILKKKIGESGAQTTENAFVMGIRVWEQSMRIWTERLTMICRVREWIEGKCGKTGEQQNKSNEKERENIQ